MSDAAAQSLAVPVPIPPGLDTKNAAAKATRSPLTRLLSSFGKRDRCCLLLAAARRPASSGQSAARRAKARSAAGWGPAPPLRKNLFDPGAPVPEMKPPVRRPDGSWPVRAASLGTDAAREGRWSAVAEDLKTEGRERAWSEAVVFAKKQEVATSRGHHRVAHPCRGVARAVWPSTGWGHAQDTHETRRTLEAEVSAPPALVAVYRGRLLAVGGHIPHELGRRGDVQDVLVRASGLVAAPSGPALLIASGRPSVCACTSSS